MSTNWTEDQQRAICETGGNILVSAAAGSGKTAVLIERILKAVQEKTDIDRLLVVTFTTAAAAELRERLYFSLQRKLDSEDLPAEQARRLSRQQTLLSKSYVTTIHAFCQNVIKSNSVESGIDASFRIADSGEIAMLREDVMDDVIEAWYQTEASSFFRLIDVYGSYRSDRGLIDQIFSLYDFAQSSPDPELWLQKQKESFDPEKISDFTETSWCADLVRDLLITAVSYQENFLRLTELCRRFGIAEYLDMLERDIPVLEKTVRALQQCEAAGTASTKWKDLYQTISAMRFERAPVMTAKRKAAYDEAALAAAAAVKEERTKLVNKIKDALLSKMGDSPEAPYEDLALLKEDMACLIDVTLNFSETYAKRKREMHLLDFNDLEHIAFRTLSVREADGSLRKSEVAERYSAYFEEVYIDEYQDTNELQDAILSLVSRSGGAPARANLFLVGDVKQSIYGFRQARPDLFASKYKKYGRQPSADKLVILNRNFRSRQSVLTSVNRVFRKIMTEHTCGISYGEEEALHFGASYYPEDREDRETELYVIRRGKANREESPNYEAEATAEIVKDLIDRNYQVYDRTTGALRGITFRDIVILMRAPSSGNLGETYAQSLKKRGIPAYYAEDGGFFANAEVNILLSFLKVIDNPLQDIHFVAMMRNVYGFQDSDLAEIKADNLRRGAEEESFYEMCLHYSGAPALRERLNRLTERVAALRKISLHIPVSELVWTLMQENHFYEHLKTGPLGELHTANINILYARAIIYDNSTNKGLFRFLYYFDNLKKRKGDLAEAAAAAEGMNVVRIMSIHKSKGLEFPVVILSETGKSFNKKDTGAPLLKHRLLGLGPTCYREDLKVKYPSVMKFCVARRLEADNQAEEMRILYVAMTRAAEKLILTGSIRTEFDKYQEICKNKCSAITGEPLEYHVLNADCFLDWLMMCGVSDAGHTHFLEEPEPSENEESPASADAAQRLSLPIPPPPMTFYREENEKENAFVPAKLSVSDLKRIYDLRERGEALQLHAPRVKMAEMPDFAYEDNSDLTAAERGTAVHTCLQQIDYRRIRGIGAADAANYIEELVLRAEDEGFLSRSAAASVSKALLAEYLTSALAQRIAGADEVRKEIPFTQLIEAEGSVTAVQGMIDCLIREGDKYTVIDFKTDEHPDPDRYRIQLACYAESIRRTFGSEPDRIVYFMKQNQEVQL